MLLHYLSYLAVLAAFAFVTLSLASGLLYISELIEEHSRMSKVIGQRGIYTIIVLHLLLYLSDSLPLLYILFSIFCHVVYLQNFSSTWPLISLSSAPFLASCALVICDHFMWFFYFSRLAQDVRIMSHKVYHGGRPIPTAPGFLEIATFFGVCVWQAPLFLFLSLSANDNALPTASPGEPSPSSVSNGVNFPQRTSLFRSLFSTILPKRGSRTSPEGIIAPHSPVPSVPPSPTFYRRTHSPVPSFSNFAPPRSPGGALPPSSPSFNVNLSPNFSLGNPPRRNPQAVRRATTDVSDLGIRTRPSTRSSVDNLDT